MNKSKDVKKVKYNKVKMINDTLFNIIILLTTLDLFEYANKVLFYLNIITIILGLFILMINILKWLKYYSDYKKGIVEYEKADKMQYVLVAFTSILLGFRLAFLIY